MGEKSWVLLAVQAIINANNLATKATEQLLAALRGGSPQCKVGYIHNEYGHRYDNFEEAAEYWQKAASLLPEGEKKDQAHYLNEAGFNLFHIARYNEALSLFEQSLAIRHEIGDRAGEDNSLNNISQIYYARGDYDTALKYLEQALAIQQEIGNRYGEVETSWNIGVIYKKQGDLVKAEPYMSRTVEIEEVIDHPNLESDRKALEELRAEIKEQQST